MYLKGHVSPDFVIPMLLQQNCFQIQSETTSLQGGEKREKVWQQTQEQQQR
jgi:hypothetical protein